MEPDPFAHLLVKDYTYWAVGADWMNYAFLGNDTRHLHGHVISRYQSPRMFAGTQCTDERWGKNYQTDRTFVVGDAVLQQIKEALTKELA